MRKPPDKKEPRRQPGENLTERPQNTRAAQPRQQPIPGVRHVSEILAAILQGGAR